MVAVIFDMDGVLVENSAVHDEIWKMICEKYGKPKTSEEIKSIFGGTNEIFVERLLEITDKTKVKEIAVEKEALYRKVYANKIKAPKGLKDLLFDLKKNNIRLAIGTSAPKLNLDFVINNLDIRGFLIEKEALYRKVYANKIKAPKGLKELLFDLKKNNIRLAIGTSAPKVNLDFVINNLDIRGFFDVLVDESFVTKGKPDPEVYQVVSNKLGIEPSNCVVIEDSIFGIQAALAAGMHTIAITTTFPAEKLNIADQIIDSFKEISAHSIINLVNVRV